MEIPRTYTLHLHGMHCNACVLLTEEELSSHPKVTSAKSSLSTHTVELSGDFEGMTLEEIAKELSTVLSKHSLSVERAQTTVKWDEFLIAIPIALAFIGLFVFLQKIGIVNWVNAGEVSYSTAFLIGIIASLSSCMAVVGGLLLSLSATFARDKSALRAQGTFHVGRLIGFFLLGGVIGAVGSAFQLSALGTFIVSLLTGLVMLLLGVNLLNVFPWAKRLTPGLPKFLSKRALHLTELNHTLMPAIVGVGTFFLPCGFTQSMQIYTLSTGSFWSGAWTMFSFALGTLPVLAFISFGSSRLGSHARSGIFFKSAGLVVILFALFNIANSLAAMGWIAPFFNI